MQVYYGVPLSDNMHTTDEGYLVCRDVPIARTGWHDYKGVELNDPEHAPFQPYQTVRVLRTAEELFDPKVMASFEGKTITDEHPDKMLDVSSDSEHYRGHTTNIRRGGRNAEGEEEMLGDLWIKHPDLVQAVQQKRKREVSLGYKFRLAQRADGTWEQVHLRGNHVAVVPKGRAGRLITIRDSADALDVKENPMAKSLLHRVLASMSKNAEAHTEEDFANASRVLSISPTRIGRDAEPSGKEMDDDDDDDEGGSKKGKDKKGKDGDDDWKKKEKEANDAIAAKDAIIAAKDAEIARLKAGKDEDGDGLELSSVVLTDDEKIKDLFAVAGADAAYDVLKALKPHVAASNNKAVMDAFREQAELVRKMRNDTAKTHAKLVGDAAYAGLVKARKPEAVVDGQKRMRSEEGADKTGKDAHTHEGAQDDVVVSYQKTLDARRQAALTAGAAK
jgi:hypothetical protein